MKHAWEIMGSAIEEAVDKFWPLTKIWLPSLLIVTVIQYLFMLPRYMDIYRQIRDYGVYATSGFYNFVSVIFAVITIFVTCAIMVNSWRYLVKNSFKPTWAPFQFDWKTTFAVFGYYLLVLLVFLGFIAITVVLVMLSSTGMVNGFIAAQTMGYAPVGQRFIMSLSFFGYIIAVLVAFYGLVYATRASMVMITRALGDKMGFGDIIRATHPHQKLFVMITFIFLVFSSAYAVVMYFAAAIAILLPVAVLFFLPAPFGLFLGVILTFFVLLGMSLVLYFIITVASTEIYRRILAK